MQLFFNGFQFEKKKSSGGGRGSLIPLNCMLESGKGGFYVMCIFTHSYTHPTHKSNFSLCRFVE